MGLFVKQAEGIVFKRSNGHRRESVQSAATNLLNFHVRDTDEFALRGEIPVRPEAPGWGPEWAC